MKFTLLLPMAAASAFLASCANNGGGEDYDVSNPYAAPDYGDASGSPYQSDVNPAYDAPAVYEDTTPAPSQSSPSPSYSAPAAQPKVHTVVRGDSLWSISRKYGVTIDAIKRANGLTRDTAVLGAKLQIPAS
ncbi:LysM peptidoglycan-binding domain-containing protein [Luteolibacter algae]|uniref:LysM peptidoglycan-binding domain-containing protein n=1 Tax=Luteolibacter algae TaxID=454151 RepID=A0ABW5D949_9BACT